MARDCDGPEAHDASGIPARAAAGDARAQAALARHADRVARGLTQVVNLLDPDVIVLGGGLSNMAHLYTVLPPLILRYVFSDVVQTPIVKNQHGDRETATFRPRSAGPSPASFCRMVKHVVSALPMGKIVNPEGRSWNKMVG